MDPQHLIDLLFGLALAVGGWFARQIWSAINRLRVDLTKLEVDIPKSYVAKEDLRDMFQQIMNRLDKLDQKLDGKADK